MIASGVRLDSVDSPQTMNTPLHWAASYGNEDVVRTLCDSGAAVNAINAKGETPLHDAVRRGDEAVVRCLLSHGADANIKDSCGLDCFQIANKSSPDILRALSMNTVSQHVQRSPSFDSDFDRASLISDATALFTDRNVYTTSKNLESWTELLWPQPKFLEINPQGKSTPFPTDNHLKIYFDGASNCEPRLMMQAIQVSAPLLSSLQLELEYRGHRIPDHSALDGKVTCGLFSIGGKQGAYTLSVAEDNIELVAEDYAGLRYGFATLVQILRIHWLGIKTDEEENAQYPYAKSTDASSLVEDIPGRGLGVLPHRIPCLVIRDSPDMSVRAVFQDFSGCKILNAETLLNLATRIGYCKASHLFVNFEIRTTDRYQLPYTNRDLFNMTQVCEELFVKLVPSLDLQSNYIEARGARHIIESFLDDFPLSKVAHFGPNLASILLTNLPMLNGIQKRVPKIYLTVDVNKENAALINQLPPYVTVCIEGQYPFEAESLLSPRLNVVLRFTATDPGYLCPAPESVAKKAVLACRLGDKLPILGTMICDLSTGCEIMPASLSYMPELASVGVAWNRDTDMKHFSFLLPKITAQHILLDGNVEALMKQVSILGRVEHEITKFSYGLLRPNGYVFDPTKELESVVPKSKIPISVYVEMILNPDNMVLERLTPLTFKKARIELRRSLKFLDETRKSLPYNFELALVLAEVQLVTELMVLASRLGQVLCMHGTNPDLIAVNNNKVPLLGGKKTADSAAIGYNVVNVGVANLPLTVRTDLANSLLEIRSKFQHTWLSRNIASTLPNALKIYDNLFRALLPPSMQEYSKNLL
ncbi:hypothetical protein AB6A40_004770 [Gnathostoma spinigerum]|uniref:Beta-hexosaminidase bacterial type N-terminal domain-containing protein n=1 Tax=Gnathostoma spinigerum TaxID=75299 RepID=A0ABD6EFU1_9BILA